MFLIVGLGNPGEKHAQSRHNFGFMVLDALQKKISSPLNYFSFDKKTNALIFKHHDELFLAKPQTFMNNSGMAVQNLLNYYKLTPDNLVVIHDDFDLPLGKMKIVKSGGAAGHHGVESVIKEVGTPNFLRMRLGIFGQELKKVHDLKAEHVVLDNFAPTELNEVRHVVKKAIEAIIFLSTHAVTEAMNKYN
jgi:PTH1 family peptidyl-tRNA hydrolase